MKSNFEFLNDEELTREYYSKAVDAETSYCIGQYASAQTAMRAVAENMARDIADQLFINIKKHATFSNVLTLLKTDPRAVKDGRITKNVIKLFYKLKQPGNVAAHTLTTGNQQEALASLKTLYILCVWFSNSFFDKNIQPNRFEEPRKEDFLYSTVALQPKVEANTAIYIQTVDQSQNLAPDYEGQHKIGQATIETLSENNTDNSPDLRRAAQKRIDQYMKTSGLHSLLEWAELAYRDKGDKAGWFTDHDVHHVLENSHIPHSPKLSGNEWFQTDVETAKKAIKAVKAGVTSLDELQDREKQPQIKLRPEQEAAIKKTIAGFRSGKRFLWNAKMRFGKTLTALKLVKEEKYQKVLIMTHRPVVDEGWFEDFQKMEMPQAGYVYGTKKLSRQARKLGGHDSVEELEKTDQPYIFFASIQDLGGSESVGGKISDKNQDLFDANWDLVIVDEAHEGTQTELTQNILKRVLKKKTKELDLSGTPFNILSSYDPDHVFTWDYTMEQTAKSTWSEDNPGKDNPYADLPKVSMFTFEMTDHFTDPNYTGEGFDKYTFNFKEFFRVDKNGNFVHEKDVERFLDNITNPGRNNYPFSTRQFRNRLRHTLWIMPGIKEANALEDLLEKHSVFGKEYRILNVVRNDKTENNEGSDNDAEKENEAIAQADKEGLKTITLTVRKLTTGATIPEWTAVLFLANTNSAMQYLQAAFRAQTPYNSPEFGKKENCYIFDFAPDRALTVMAEASSLSTGVGKLHKKEQKQRMTSLMNFLPIIGEEGQRMKPFKVDTLLAKIKRAYAEKAVRTGFDDDSIYSDALLTINETDLKLLKDVKAHVGSTKKQKLDRVINVNKQGLTEAEYDQAEEAKKKKPRERTPEEQAAIDKEKQQKKQRRVLIDVLRGVSIRIPMLIYGMDINFDEDISINNFTNRIDDVSWEEFMPQGITKEKFNQLVKYYDAEVFIEAGRMIRSRVKELDKADPLERVDKLADIFSTFRNPDKETVLTPWRVVNMHLGQTIGGLSFYDENYESQYEGGKKVNRWIQTEYTNQTLSNDSHVLEINSKTGLYPLYVVTSIYWHDFQKFTEQTAGRFSLYDEQSLWRDILEHNIFLVAKTPMAKEIAIRTLAGYHKDWKVNVEYVENIVDDSKKDVKAEAKKIEGLFNNMKFDVVIGNPPYQQSANGASTRDEPIYNQFMDLSYKLSDLVTLITPGRFLFDAGQTPKKWNHKMLHDPHLKVVFYDQVSDDVFPRTDVKGGIAITLRDASSNFGILDIYAPNPILREIVNNMWSEPMESFSQMISSTGLYRFAADTLTSNPEILKITGQGTGKKITSKIFEKATSLFTDNPTSSDDVKIFGLVNKRRRAKYINKKYIADNDFVNSYKVMLPKANGNGFFWERLSQPFLSGPGDICTDTFLNIGPVSAQVEAEHILKYIKTKFCRAMLGVRKITQDNPKSAWKYVPMQDFSSASDIDWQKSVADIDQQLYEKYDFTVDQITFIETKVQDMK